LRLTSPAITGLIDAIDLGLVLIDRHGIIRLWNDWMVQRSGISAATALGQPLTALFPSLAGTRLDLAVTAAVQQGQSAVLSHQLNPLLFPLTS
ncbi:PAS domain-containing protein, partial [Acinetobacter baumannii]